MKQLHSRTGNERPGRPCQLAAQSGRRAAQDGHGTVPGGPERAGEMGSGEALSAGRAAAPGACVSAEGRGRSADRVGQGHGEGALAQRARPAELGQLARGEAVPSARARRYQAMARAVVLAVAAACMFIDASAFAAQVAGPSGNIVIQVTNDSESAVPLQNVNVVFKSGPSFLHVPASQGPVASIAVGAVGTFTFPYTIDSNATDGEYEAIFTVVPEGTQNSESPDGSFDTSVKFTRSVGFSVVDGLV